MKKTLLPLFILCPAFLLAQSVAINTDGSPPDNNAILDIKSSTKGLLIPRLTTLQRTSIAGPVVGLTVYDIDTYNYWVYRGDVNGGWVEFLSHLDKHWDRTGTHVFNTNPGNIGIGTNGPTEKLTINAIDPAIRFLNSNTEKGLLKSEGNDMKLGTYASNISGNIQFNIRGVDRMTVASDGKIGIGITTPISRLHVGSGFEASLSSHGYLMMGAENGSNLIMDNNEIMARNNGAASHLYLQNEGGNVTIGDPSFFNSFHRLGVEGNLVVTGAIRIGETTGPNGYKLAVDGKAICTELLVRLVNNWPDYVFSKEHKLRDLTEVEDFIIKNSHLPGIPSAKTLEENGMNIGDMQKLQMEKIEELTLYIIELKKDIEKLKVQK